MAIDNSHVASVPRDSSKSAFPGILVLHQQHLAQGIPLDGEEVGCLYIVSPLISKYVAASAMVLLTAIARNSLVHALLHELTVNS